MAVDMLRSCYSTQAQLLRGSTRKSTIVWYFVDDAPFLPYPAAVNSLNWVPLGERAAGAGYTGEVPGAARPYRDGAPPVGFTGPSGVPWGTESDFQLGGLLSLMPNPIGPDGLPVCCSRCAFAGAQLANDLTCVVAGFVDGAVIMEEANGNWDYPTDVVGGDCDWGFSDVAETFSGTVGFFLTVINVQFIFVYGMGLIVINYSLPVTWPPAPGTYVLPLITTVDPVWGTVPPSVSVIVRADCGVVPGDPITTETLDPITTETLDPITAS